MCDSIGCGLRIDCHHGAASFIERMLWSSTVPPRPTRSTTAGSGATCGDWSDVRRPSPMPDGLSEAVIELEGVVVSSGGGRWRNGRPVVSKQWGLLHRGPIPTDLALDQHGLVELSDPRRNHRADDRLRPLALVPVASPALPHSSRRGVEPTEQRSAVERPAALRRVRHSPHERRAPPVRAHSVDTCRSGCAGHARITTAERTAH